MVLGAAKSCSEAAYDAKLSGEVHARLFPQVLPASTSLSYAGVSLPARGVGGDLYDILDLGQGRVGFVVGDVMGKGFAAALQMATLLAQLRTHVNLGFRDIGSLIQSVNRLFYDCTPPTSYASLFFAEYVETDGILRYVNCGHPAAVIVRFDGAIERLESCATLLGLNRELACTPSEVRLAKGDTLILYSDGITESVSASGDGDEFGERRLSAIVRANRWLPISKLLKAITDAVDDFTSSEQADDMTLVAARCVA